MTTTAIKTKLHKLIDKNEDKEFLSELVNMVTKANSDKDWWDELNSVEKEELEEASRSIKKNGGTPHHIVMKKSRKWITK